MHTDASSSPTCRANSLVGHSTIMLGSLPRAMRRLPSRMTSAFPLFFAISTSLVRDGMPNASVLPVPVRDRPMTSLPARTGAMALAWTGVQWVMPLWDSTSMTDRGTPQDSVQWGLVVERNLGSL